jgi:NAD(P)H-hydrate epimerase
VKPIITPEESARLDEAATTPVATLMERAGLAVAIAAAEMGVGYGSRVIVLAGPGSNGGDGWVAARHLRERGVFVEVEALGYPRGDGSAARLAAIAAVHAGVRARRLGLPRPATLVIDALFGAGFHGTLPDPVVPWVDIDAPVLSIDLPSGLDGATGLTEGPAFTADRTVTFHASKVGHLFGEGPERSGAITVADIGLSGERPALLLCEDADAPVPARPRTAHKWSAGSVAVMGGSPGISGAALLSARSALEFGAGAAAVVCPGGLAGSFAAADPGVMTRPIGSNDRFTTDDAGAALEAADRFDVLALGPGLGPDQDGLVAKVVDAWAKPLVLDADGITVATLDALAGRTAPTIVTPHAAEFERLTGFEPTHGNATKVAAETGVTVLLKGSPTVIAGGGETWVVTSGGPELATIGTGDVLTGMVASLVARGLAPEVAARSAAHRHGLAGRSLAARTSVTATALAAEIGRFER